MKFFDDMLDDCSTLMHEATLRNYAKYVPVEDLARFADVLDISAAMMHDMK